MGARFFFIGSFLLLTLVVVRFPDSKPKDNCRSRNQNRISNEMTRLRPGGYLRLNESCKAILEIPAKDAQNKRCDHPVPKHSRRQKQTYQDLCKIKPANSDHELEPGNNQPDQSSAHVLVADVIFHRLTNQIRAGNDHRREHHRAGMAIPVKSPRVF